MMWGYGWGGWFLGALMMLLFWGGLVALVVFAMRGWGGGQRPGSPGAQCEVHPGGAFRQGRDLQGGV